MIAPLLGNYDNIQQPRNISEAARKNIPFFMFIDEKTEAVMKNSSDLDSSKKFGFWRIIVVRNIPYSDPRRNGKVSMLLFVWFFFFFFWFCFCFCLFICFCF